jgi:uncharacterized protein YjcR
MARKAATVDDIEALDLEEFDDADEVEEAAATKKGKSKSKKDSTPKGIGASQLAEHLGAEPKTFRAWLRRKQADDNSGIDFPHDAKTRYDFGASFDSPLAKSVIKAWNSESHEKGAGIEKAQAARKAKQAAAKKTGTGAKKKVAK